MTEEAAPYEHNHAPGPITEAMTALDQCVEHLLSQVCDGHASVAALIVYKDVQGNVTFLVSGQGATYPCPLGGGHRFLFVEAAPEGCEPQMPS